jgi:predicted DNA binding CopG/RHH family protein
MPRRPPTETPPAQPERRVQRVNVDFPIELLRRIDREVARLGISRQAYIKLRIADTLPKG